ncbi:MAG: ABC transporter ATP-binding protein [Desulfobacterales bacterium]|nr:ABC transporter ATP-binding protein [Desulfobacterales bacterium]
MDDLAIHLENISKKYHLYDAPVDRMKEALHPFRKKYHKEFYALDNISFDVKKGETVGIVGRNGAGKSTLLKILTGVLTPSNGNVVINGKISALLELGAGFNPELDGLENIYFSGMIMGFSREEMEGKIDDILSFADIGDFVYQPVKSYSSGMFVRLAFSIATAVNPDVLIVDEALSVGDMFFQAKSVSRMRDLINNGATLLFVSHDTNAVKSLCERAILLQNGQMADDGSSEKVLEKYFSLKVAEEQSVIQSEEDDSDTSEKDVPNHSLEDKNLKAFMPTDSFLKRASDQRIQNGIVSFKNVILLDETENEITSVAYDQNVILRMGIEANQPVRTLNIGYHIRDKNGLDIVYSDNVIENTKLVNLLSGERYILDWNFKMALIEGYYNISCVLSLPIDISIGKVDFCDFIPFAKQFVVEPRPESSLYGCVHLENKLTIEKVCP